MIVAEVAARTPVGLTACQTALVGRAGGIGLRESPWRDERGQACTMGIVPSVEGFGESREQSLALSVFEELLEAAPFLSNCRLAVHLMVAEPEGGESDRLALRRSVEERLRQHSGGSSTPRVELHACGAGGGAAVLAIARRQLDAREYDAILFGGVHSDCAPGRLRLLAEQGRIHSPDNRDGIIPGEGAALTVLMLPEAARTLRAPARATIVGSAAGTEGATPYNDDSAFTAAGLTLAVRQALQASGGQKVGWLLNDLTTEMYRIYEYQAVLARNQEFFCPPQAMDAPAQRLGNQGAAGLPLHIAIATEAWRRGFAPFPRALSTTGSDGGARTAVLLAAAQA